MDRNVSVGSVITVDNYNDDWNGCLMFVDEVYSWGVMAGMYVPYKGVTFLRLKWDEFFVV